jgi:hypothetical protein
LHLHGCFGRNGSTLEAFNDVPKPGPSGWIGQHGLSPLTWIDGSRRCLDELERLLPTKIAKLSTLSPKRKLDSFTVIDGSTDKHLHLGSGLFRRRRFRLVSPQNLRMRIAKYEAGKFHPFDGFHPNQFPSCLRPILPSA